jgi:hypothetical protein
MFRLQKWYLDLVTGDGTAVWCHAAQLRLGAVPLQWSAVIYTAPDRPSEETTSLRGLELPHAENEVLTWRSRPLAFDGAWEPMQPPISATLLESDAGAIRWNCWMPAARVRAEWRGATLSGLGYAESLELSIAPDRLPFRVLRWGRHVSDRHSVVWIEWDREARRQWCWLDGVERSGASASAGGVALGAGMRLQFTDTRSLLATTPRTRLADVIPRLGATLARWLVDVRENKMVSCSALVAPDGAILDTGWAIHETVTW